jgi:hypothetical protein
LKIECQDTEETGKYIDEYIRVGLWCLTPSRYRGDR